MSTWNLGWAIRNIVAELLMPPSIWIVLGLFFLIFLRRHKKIQSILVGLMFIMIWVTTTTVFSQNLYQLSNLWMHWPKPFDLESINSQDMDNQLQKALLNDSKQLSTTLDVDTLKQTNTNIINSQTITENAVRQQRTSQTQKAIVILGGGVRSGAFDLLQYQNQDVSKEAMERLRMGARIAKKSNLPILVTGGRPDRTNPKDRSEGEIMAQVLNTELGVQARWIESESQTTQENAEFSAKILKENNINSIYLVTNDWHLPRAIKIFEKEELEVISVPTGFNHKEKWTPLDYFPGGEGFNKTRQIWHESIGSLWYALRF